MQEVRVEVFDSKPVSFKGTGFGGQTVFMIGAKIIADSKNIFGDRITSFELLFPRMILAEFNTHRMISKNSASSRAIKFEKMLEMVLRNPFIPIKWMKDHKGMQGYEYFSETDLWRNSKKITMPYVLEKNWLNARDKAVKASEILSNNGLTKQFCNRLLESFMWHKVIATGTEWENFFALRNHPDAEIHMQELAKSMLSAMNNSQPALLKEGGWHIPYGDDITNEKLQPYLFQNHETESERNEIRVKIATARCAGVSYTVIGEDGEVEDYSKLIKRHDRLLASGHMSPFEHCARAIGKDEYYSATETKRIWGTGYVDNGWCGNFKGFKQYRKTLTGENKKYDLLLK